MMKALMTGLQLGLSGIGSQMRMRPVRTALQVIAIALGIALGLAVHLIHTSALDSFASGVRQFSGTADRVVRGPKVGFDLSIVDKLLQVDAVSAVSPVLELEIGIAGLEKPVKWLGIDFMRAASVTPHLIGRATDSDDFFDSHAVFLSPALSARLNAAEGDTLRTTGTDGEVSWRVAGLLTETAGDSLMAVSDIAAAQWRLGLLDRVHRIDLKAGDGVSLTQLDNSIEQMLPAGLWLDNPDEAGSRGAAVSRAYRVNLSILALVALLTGCFLIYASQTLAAMERSRQWALLNALGADPGVVRAQLLTESLTTGLLGSLTGTALGIAAASAVLNRLGADLGGGYFQAYKPQLSLTVCDAALFVLLGCACSVAGAWKPAAQAAQTPGTAALKSGMGGAQQAMAAHWPMSGLAGLVLCPLLALVPAINGLPLGGYAAIACGLFGGISCMPALLQTLTPDVRQPRSLAALSHLKTRHSPGHSGIALAGIVASFSLVIAMAIMVFSFRQSLVNWLDEVLPAPLYLRVQAGDLVGMDEQVQQRLRAVKGVERAEFWTSQPVSLSAARPPVTLVMRPLDRSNPQSRLPLVVAADSRWPDGAVPIWISEATSTVYGWQQGQVVTIPLPELQGRQVHIAGIWRDYARQGGSIVMALDDAQGLGLALRLTDAAFWPEADISIGELTQGLKAVLTDYPWGARVEFAESQFIREISMKIFDRSFAVTYLLEAAAIGIGLMGIASTFAATALARKQEFAALLAMGADMKHLLKMLMTEGFSVALTGVGSGLFLGTVFSLILVHVVNPQSFNWTMEVHMPWGLLAILSAALLLLASLTAALAGWAALRGNCLDILKEDHG